MSAPWIRQDPVLARLFGALSQGERQDLTDQMRPFRGGESGGR